MLALASLGLSAPKEAPHDKILATDNLVAFDLPPVMDVMLGPTKSVKQLQCVDASVREYDEHELAKRLMEIELRFKQGGYFDNAYYSKELAKWIGGRSCTSDAAFALSLVLNLRDVLKNDIGVLPGSTPETPPHKVRYFPNDALMRHLYGCADSQYGHECSNSSQAALMACPPGSSKMLVDTLFTAVKADPRFSCIRLVPNKYQRTGFAADKSWQAWELGKEKDFHSREGKVFYVGTKIEGATQRSNLFNTSAWYKDGEPLDHWLLTPASSTMEEAVKFRYLLDVGGSSGTTWDALGWKMASGSLVFKVSSISGAEDYWHSEMQKGVHFIEVMPNLADLREKWLWAVTHPDEAKLVAHAGQKLALKWASKEYAVRRTEDVLRDAFDYPKREEQYD